MTTRKADAEAKVALLDEAIEKAIASNTRPMVSWTQGGTSRTYEGLDTLQRLRDYYDQIARTSSGPARISLAKRRIR